jgi:uncharacterized protein YqjF (DUF2071 family)
MGYLERYPAQIDAQLIESVDSSEIAREPLDRFLLERYRFWAKRKSGGQSSFAQIRHRPYDAVRLENANYKGGLFDAFGLPEPQNLLQLLTTAKGFQWRHPPRNGFTTRPATQTRDK